MIEAINKNNKEYSNATHNNWSRLGTDYLDGKLMNRANKRLSTKRFIPQEYIQYSPLIQKAYSYHETGYTVEEILYSLILNKSKNISNIFIHKELKQRNISQDRIIRELLTIDIVGIGDILGGIYQSLLTEGEKNKKGSYYTPDFIVRNQINTFFVDGRKVIDPCCGTGQYLINIPSRDPLCIRGVDLDELAVKIARINLMIQYPDKDFEPNIFHFDSLLSTDGLFDNSILQENFFDMVLTNPPWGSKIEKKYTGYSISSGESFSYFLERGLKLLKQSGMLTYILPESILNVKVHEDIRKKILEYDIVSIYELGRIFTGVFTSAIRIDIKKQQEDGNINIYTNNINYNIHKSLFQKNHYSVFSIHLEKNDNDFIEKIYAKKNIFLSNENADWALGIVTGNNKDFISNIMQDGFIPVYTGKEVFAYRLGRVKKYLSYDPKKYQQMAPLERYHTKPKLIYKFISKRLVFSLDNEGVFTLNSANIIIPKINYPIKVIAALFNSEIYQKIFQKKFNSIKVLKSHIQELPLPILENTSYSIIEAYFDDIILGNAQKKDLDDYIFTLLTK